MAECTENCGAPECAEKCVKADAQERLCGFRSWVLDSFPDTRERSIFLTDLQKLKAFVTELPVEVSHAEG